MFYVDSNANICSCSLIDYKQKHSIMPLKGRGDVVNLEVDVSIPKTHSEIPRLKALEAKVKALEQKY
jgi:riboflavin synthase alpha subunit